MKTKNYMMIQRVGDRDKPSLSIKPYAFTIPANPMSDRVQMVIEYETNEEYTEQGCESPM